MGFLPFIQDLFGRAGIVMVVVMMSLAPIACSSNDDEPEYVERPVEDLYNSAMNTLLAEYLRSPGVSQPPCSQAV